MIEGLDQPNDSVLVAPLNRMIEKTADLVEGDAATIPLWMELYKSRRLYLNARAGEYWLHWRGTMILEAAPREFARIVRLRTQNVDGLKILATPAQITVAPGYFPTDTPAHTYPGDWTAKPTIC